MSHCPSIEALQQLSPQVVGHIAGCEECRAMVALMQSASSIHRQDGCVRAEVLMATGGARPLEETDAAFLRVHLAHCSACRAVALDPTPGEPLGLPAIAPDTYVLGAEIGRGGMGRVVAAYDRRIGRAVAVKEMLARDGLALARFVREARLTARLQHPAIVSIYEVAQWPDGRPFYAMPILPGRTLREALLRCATIADRLRLLPALTAATEAIAYAHSMRIIHRDLSPSNILLGPFGETVVIDWGVAKEIDGEANDTSFGPVNRAAAGGPVTVAGTVMGTPAYSAPEQRAGRPVDERADVYALGAIMAEVLFGDAHWSFGDRNKQKTSPRAASRSSRKVPRDLASVVRKATNDDVDARYPTAQELVEDLRLYQTGGMVRAHRYTLRELASRWLSQHLPLVVTTVVALVAITAAVIFASVRVERERNQAEATAITLLEEQGRQELLSGSPSRAFGHLHEAYRRGLRSSSLRFLLAAASRSVDAVVMRRDGVGEPLDLSLSATGEKMALAYGGRVEVWETQTGKLLHTFRGAPLNRVRFTRDGTRLLTWGEGVTIWSLLTGQPQHALPVGGRVLEVQLNEDERLLLTTGSVDAAAGLWELETGRELRRLTGPEREDHQGMKFTQGGRQLVILHHNGRVMTRDTRSGRLLHSFKIDASAATTFDARHDGRRLLTRDPAHGTRLWNAEGGVEVARLADTARAHFIPNSERILALGHDGEGRLLDSSSGNHIAWLGRLSAFGFGADTAQFATANNQLQAILTRTGDVVGRHDGAGVTTRLALSDDGRWLAAASSAGVVQSLDLSNGSLVRTISGSDVWRLEGFLGQSSDLVSMSVDRALRMWPGASRAGAPVRLRIASPLATTPDLKLALHRAPEDGSILVVRNTLTDEEVHRFAVGAVDTAAISPDGSRAITQRTGSSGILWDVRSGRIVAPLPERVSRFAFDPAGGRIVGHSSSFVFVYEARRGTLVAAIDAGPWGAEAIFSDDGERVALLGLRRTEIWDARQGRFLYSIDARVAPSDAAFSPDGKLLAILQRPSKHVRTLGPWVRGAPEVAILDANDGRQLAVVHAPGARQATFAPGSNLLVTVGRRASQVWHWETERLLAHFSGDGSANYYRGPFPVLRFNKRGDRLAVGHAEPAVVLWNISSEVPGLQDLDALARKARRSLAVNLTGIRKVPDSTPDAFAASATNLDFERGTIGAAPPGWQTDSAGYAVALSDEQPRHGRGSLRFSSWDKTGEPGFAYQAIPAGAYRGKKVTLRAQVRPGWLADGLQILVRRRQDRLSVLEHPFPYALDERFVARNKYLQSWLPGEISGHVDPDAEVLEIGVALPAGRELWLDDVTLEVVGR